MKAFTLVRPTTLAGAAAALGTSGSVLKANGTDLLDRLKERLVEPERVVSLADVPASRDVVAGPDGSLFLGALVTLQALADAPLVRERFPALAQAAGLAASPQLRRRATLGGNLAQHSRCGYYRLATFPCVKRGAEACPVRAPGAVQDTAGVFANDLCAGAHPSSLAPVLGALDAVVQVVSSKELRAVPFAALWAAPQRGRATDLTLAADELIAGVTLPPAGTARTGYEEVRSKAAFDWALVSAAVRLDVSGGPGGAVTAARVWLGSVAPTPWRAEAAEAALVGVKLGASAADLEARAAAAGEAALRGASPLPGNAYKLALVTVAVKRAVLHAARGRS